MRSAPPGPSPGMTKAIFTRLLAAGKLDDGIGGGARVLHRDNKARAFILAGKLARPGRSVRDDARQAAGHGLKQGIGCPLKARREDEELCRANQWKRIGEMPVPVDAVGDSESLSQRLELAAQRAVAHDRQAPARQTWRSTRPRGDKDIETLLL